MYKFAEEYGANCSGGSDDFRAVPGRGLECRIDDAWARIGNKAWMEDNAIVVGQEIQAAMQSLQVEGKTAMLLSVGSAVVAVVAVADMIRPESKLVVDQLQAEGIEVWMVSGDNVRTAQVRRCLTGGFRFRSSFCFTQERTMVVGCHGHPLRDDVCSTLPPVMLSLDGWQQGLLPAYIPRLHYLMLTKRAVAYTRMTLLSLPIRPLLGKQASRTWLPTSSQQAK